MRALLRPGGGNRKSWKQMEPENKGKPDWRNMPKERRGGPLCPRPQGHVVGQEQETGLKDQDTLDNCSDGAGVGKGGNEARALRAWFSEALSYHMPTRPVSYRLRNSATKVFTHRRTQGEQRIRHHLRCCKSSTEG